jgi:hypothetical protein
MIRWIALTLSAAFHGGLLVWTVLVLAGPRPFVPAPEQAILVDIVPETVSGSLREDGAAEQHRPQAAAQEQPAAAEAAAAPQAVDPTRPADMVASDEPLQFPPYHALAMLDPASIPTLLNRTTVSFEPPAERAADLTRKDVAEMRAQLRKCWQLPRGTASSSSTRVVLRVGFAPNGGLRGDPMLLEASASREGPAVMQAALHALRDCQPYASLPAERYGEWKVLDLTFSPREMSGS